MADARVGGSTAGTVNLCVRTTYGPDLPLVDFQHHAPTGRLQPVLSSPSIACTHTLLCRLSLRCRHAPTSLARSCHTPSTVENMATPGANCVMIKKCTEEIRAKLKILDEDDGYTVTTKPTLSPNSLHLRYEKTVNPPKVQCSFG